MEWAGADIFPVKDALEMVLVFDDTGNILYGNDAAVKELGYEEDLCGVSIRDVFPNDIKSSSESIKEDVSFGCELQNLVAYRKNRTCFPVEARMIQSDTHAGKYICMANDMLEREQLSREVTKGREDARQALKVKSEFVANVTHELRTPVNGVLGNIRELLDIETDKQKLRPMHMIEQCCEDMHKIINNILDFSKLEAGKFSLEQRKFNFRDMLDYVKANHMGKITEKGLEFFMTVSPQVPEYVIGDELRIKQVLNNLLSNALKFTAVGKVTLEVLKTAQVNDQVELFFLVIDSGIGIDKADKDKLFQSFSQVDASISRKYGGTGLGLNICKQLVELMGGRIGVESEKGHGSAFSFSAWVGTEETGDEQLSSFTKASVLMSARENLRRNKEGSQYGGTENREAVLRNLGKLVLCVEMGNWEKAEMFMDTIRQLTEGAPPDVGRMVLRLKMAVQKENYDRIINEYKKLEDFLQSKEVHE